MGKMKRMMSMALATVMMVAGVFVITPNTVEAASAKVVYVSSADEFLSVNSKLDGKTATEIRITKDINLSGKKLSSSAISSEKAKVVGWDKAKNKAVNRTISNVTTKYDNFYSWLIYADEVSNLTLKNVKWSLGKNAVRGDAQTSLILANTVKNVTIDKANVTTAPKNYITAAIKDGADMNGYYANDGVYSQRLIKIMDKNKKAVASNIKFKNITYTGKANNQLQVSSINFYVSKGTVDNITVDGVTLNASIASFYPCLEHAFGYNGDVSINKVSVKNVKVKKEVSCAQMVTRYSNAKKLSNITVDGVSVDASLEYFCGIGYLDAANVTLSNVTVKNIKVKKVKEQFAGIMTKYWTYGNTKFTLKNVDVLIKAKNLTSPYFVGFTNDKKGSTYKVTVVADNKCSYLDAYKKFKKTAKVAPTLKGTGKIKVDLKQFKAKRVTK